MNNDKTESSRSLDREWDIVLRKVPYEEVSVTATAYDRKSAIERAIESLGIVNGSNDDGEFHYSVKKVTSPGEVPERIRNIADRYIKQ